MSRSAGVAQLVELQFSKLNVASSSLVSRSKLIIVWRVSSPCGSVVEHSLGKGEVAGPIPAMGTTNRSWVRGLVGFERVKFY